MIGERRRPAPQKLACNVISGSRSGQKFGQFDDVYCEIEKSVFKIIFWRSLIIPVFFSWRFTAKAVCTPFDIKRSALSVGCFLHE
jgi:hypothetical protein